MGLAGSTRATRRTLTSLPIVVPSSQDANARTHVEHSVGPEGSDPAVIGLTRCEGGTRWRKS